MNREEFLINILDLSLRNRKIIEYRRELDNITGDKVVSLFLNQLIKYWIAAKGNAFYKFLSPPIIEENEDNDTYLEKIKFYKIGESWTEELNEDKETILYCRRKTAHCLNYVYNETKQDKEQRILSYQENCKRDRQGENEKNSEWIERIDPLNVIKNSCSYITTSNNQLTFYNIEEPELVLNVINKIVYKDNSYNKLLYIAK